MKKNPNILVVGSFVMDQIAVMDAIPRPGQTILGDTFSKAPGGKGANQAVQMARLGADVTFVGKLGRDANGQEMLCTCQQAGVQTDWVLFDETHASGCAVILLEKQGGASVQNRIIVIPGANMAITEQDIRFLEEKISQFDLVVLQLEIPMEINERVAAYARKKGVPVLLNPAPSAPLSPELISNLTFLCPNESEAENLTGIQIRRNSQGVCMMDVHAAAQELKKKGAANVLITLGDAGAFFQGESEEYYCPSVPDITAVDPTAAGDSFIGAFGWSICSGHGIAEAMKFANEAAALTVMTVGAMPSLPTRDQVQRFVQERRSGGCAE